MTEQKIQANLIKKLESDGHYVIKLSVTNKAGIPDLISIPKDSDLEFYEVKRPGKKPSAIQEYRIKELRKHGIKVHVYDGTSK